MDFLRSCNVLRTRVYDGSGQETWLRWYITAPDAPAYPHPHAFGHPVWETDRNEFVGPGCFFNPLIWRPNAYPATPTYTPIGTPEDFAFGLISGEPPVEPVPCGGPGIVSEGGVCGCGAAWPPHPVIQSRVVAGGHPVPVCVRYTCLVTIAGGAAPGVSVPISPSVHITTRVTGGAVPGISSPTQPTYSVVSRVAGGGHPAESEHIFTGAYSDAAYSAAWDTFR